MAGIVSTLEHRRFFPYDNLGRPGARMKSYLKNAASKAVESVELPDGVKATVETVIASIRARGDASVREYSERFDNWSPESFLLTAEQIASSIARLPQQTIDDIRTVQANVRRFAELQLGSITDFESEVEPGVFLGQRNIPIDAVGAYIPGGRYPLLASAHMTIVTAKVAGVRRVAAATPASGGVIPDASIAAIHFAGADEIYLLGGVQAVAALAIGTETIAPVDFLAGPGNAYVAEAKRQLFGEVGIDLFAGPTEVLVVADDSADAFLVAVDLLSQAEHGPDSPAILITTSQALGGQVLEEIGRQLPGLSTREVAEAAWRDHGEVIVVEDLDEAYVLADAFASEHVQILTREPREALATMSNYGALFLGENTCVSFGDKVIGTNHVLPTRQAARYTGGLWVGKFLKTVTYQEITSAAASAALGELLGRAARAENFEGHARSGDVRVARLSGQRPLWALELSSADDLPQ
jgi:sulfopropanediol 3-dehydrogenase